MFNGYSNDDELGDTVLEHCVIRSLPDIQSSDIMDDSQLLYVWDVVRVFGSPIINMKW